MYLHIPGTTVRLLGSMHLFPPRAAERRLGSKKPMTGPKRWYSNPIRRRVDSSASRVAD
ncbi:MAG: putative ligase [uncultured Paraburkholderia sp.]|nr:MAG: putative ligase [uncultured Paraburkholderia sp.]